MLLKIVQKDRDFSACLVSSHLNDKCHHGKLPCPEQFLNMDGLEEKDKRTMWKLMGFCFQTPFLSTLHP